MRFLFALLVQSKFDFIYIMIKEFILSKNNHFPWQTNLRHTLAEQV